MPTTVPPTSAPVSPPTADRRPIIREHHGDTFVDDFEWLRDKADPDVIGYLEAENAYTKSRTQHLDALAEAVFSEIKARTQETDLSVPSFASHVATDATRSAFWYYTRTVEGSQYPIHCRVPAADRVSRPAIEAEIPGEQVLLDGNLEAEGHEFFSVGAFAVSPDGRRLAYSVDTTGGERFTLRVRDLDTGEPLADEIADTAYGVAWAQNRHLFYTRADDAWRPYEVLRHRLGTDPANDPVVLTEPDERFWVGVESSRDDTWVLLSLASKVTSEWWMLESSEPEGEPRLVAARRQGVEYDIEPAGDRLLIVHNDGAEDFLLAQAPLPGQGPPTWEPVLPHQPGVRILGVDAYASHVVVSLRRDGLTGMHVLPRNADGGFGAGADVSFDEPLYVMDPYGDPEYDTPSIRFGFASMLTPDSLYDYDLATGGRTLLKRTAVLPDPTHGPYAPDHYRQERGWATAADGTRVPLSIVRRADVPLDGSAPAVLYGYGSYEASIDPGFSISRLSLLDRGIVYAIAHVRGGGELGRSWYEQGKTQRKINTFTDFVACADFLVEHGYTATDRLAARGASAGGLLMGAVANLAPEKFCAIQAGVPFVDALTTILDPDLPLTVIEWEEWGDPVHDAAVYAYMKTYSPYENVRPVAYPAILATTSLNDTRVFYVEPAKWVAQLRRTAAPGSGEVLLKTEMTAGHGGVSGRYNSWREVAFEYAWLIDQTQQ